MACHGILMSAAIQVSVRELHARTGHYIRKAAAHQRVIVTDHGKAVAEIQPLLRESEAEDNPFKRRVLLPGFAKLMNRPIFFFARPTRFIWHAPATTLSR